MPILVELCFSNEVSSLVVFSFLHTEHQHFLSKLRGHAFLSVPACATPQCDHFRFLLQAARTPCVAVLILAAVIAAASGSLAAFVEMRLQDRYCNSLPPGGRSAVGQEQPSLRHNLF